MPIKMTRILLNHLVLLFALASWAIKENGTVVHLVDVRSLVESADLIVTGRVTYLSEDSSAAVTTQDGSMSNDRVRAVLASDEILKGSIATPNLPLEFFVPKAPSGIQRIPDGQYGMFFLRQAESAYKVLDPIYPFLPAVAQGRPTTGSPLDRVIAKLGEVLADKHSADRENSLAIRALATIQGKAATDALRRALQGSSGDLRLRLASKLVARNDINSLGIVESALLNPAEVPGYLLPELAGSLAGLEDPRSIPILRRLLDTNDPLIIKSVAMALRQSRSAAALEPLSRLLSNKDELVRYSAVAGLGEISGQAQWTPAFDEFHKNESKYLTHWRDWAASNVGGAVP